MADDGQKTAKKPEPVTLTVDGKSRVFVKGHPRPLECDEPLPEGAAVVIVGGKAVKAS